VFRKIRRFFATLTGRPFLEVDVVHHEDGLILTSDYNDAFVEHLKKNGYGSRGATPDEIVDAYVTDVFMAAEDQEDYE